MAHDLTSLLAAYEALSDKSSLHAQSLLGLISELDAELRVSIHRMIVEVCGIENWTPSQFESELTGLDHARMQDLELLREQLAGRLDPVHRREMGSDE